MLEIRNLKTILGNKEIHKDINLFVKEGETMVVLGPSGCGKSVLLKTLVGLLKPTSGKIIIDGKSILELKEDDMDMIRREIGLVFQGAALFDSLTVYENVGFSLRRLKKLSKKEAYKIADEKLELVGLRGIGEMKPAELSGGMKKRVGVARAIAMEPSIILYDEPTTGLDPIMVEAVNELIISMKHKLNVTSIVVTHDIESAYTVGDRISVINAGYILATGEPEEVLHSDDPFVKRFVKSDNHLWKSFILNSIDNDY